MTMPKGFGPAARASDERLTLARPIGMALADAGRYLTPGGQIAYGQLRHLQGAARP